MPDGRKKNGGKRPGAGRKPKVEEKKLRDLLDAGWPEKDRLEAIRIFAARASKGDLESFKILLAYAYGKPKEIHEISGPDGGAVLVDVTVALDKVYGRE
ncbi:MAG: hypothetical protein AB1631_17455 [Acidobacteriota bacterium]